MIAGIFVGGASRRMGRPKGLLEAPGGGTLVDRWQGICASMAIEVVLVGRRESYAELGIETLDDVRANQGPLAGLVALLERAGDDRALALACDMPFVERADLEALIATDAVVAAPRRAGRWEPLCACYDAPRALAIARARLDAGELALQGLLDVLGAREVAIDESHLEDWDSPADLSER